MSDSIWNDPRITAYVLGELSGDERAKFESEIAINAELATAVEEARVLTVQLQSHFAQEPGPPLDAARRHAILAGSHASAGVANGDRPWFKRHGWQLAIAASLLLLVVGIPALATHRGMKRWVAMTNLTTNSTPESSLPETDNYTAVKEGALSVAVPFSSRDSADGLPPAAPLGDIADAAKPFRGNEDRYTEAASPTDPQATASTQFSKQLGDAAAAVGSGSIGNPADRAEGKLLELEQTLAERDDELRGLATDAKVASEARFERLSKIAAPGAPGAPGVPAGDPIALGITPYGAAIDEGRGPGIAGDRFDPITDNAFKRVSEHPLSTFSVDVDTASYSKVRDFLVRANQLPRPDAVRIEELINYFDYEYAAPDANGEHPFAARAEVVSCPWNADHRLARIAIKGRAVAADKRQPSNLVFLIDTSGSMDAPNKLPLVQQGMKLLLSKLGENDRVAIVVYAGSAGLVLDSTPASDAETIRRALTQLAAGGSTNGGAGIELAYQTARDHFIKDGVNRVILCSDGDFNVGTTGTDALVRLVENEAQGGVFLTVLGFGMGNHNDAMLEQISGKGNGNYAFIDTEKEARKVLVEQTDATLVTIAKDVKLQVEFNPAQVSAYRLIGYENRMLAKEDFNDDQKDAGEIGAGHAVTALYEIVPAGKQADAIAPKVDDLKYQSVLQPTAAAANSETLTIKLRYKAPDGDTSQLVEFPVTDAGKSFADADIDIRFAAAVAGFGMKLRRSEYAGNWTYADVEAAAAGATGSDPYGLRAEFIELVRKAAQLTGQER
jgi:Ca-activated chloride channel family protein